MLHIEQKVLQAIVRHVESDRDEACGFFFGNVDAENRTITKSFEVINVSTHDKQSSFEISAHDYLKAESLSNKENITLLGVYHSHPDGTAMPSERDKISAQPNFIYIVVSMIKNRFAGMRAWQINRQSAFEEEKILYTKSIEN